MSDYMPKCATCEHFESCIIQKHLTEMALILWNISKAEDKADRKDESSSEKPNNCEYEDIFEYCPRCGMRILVSKPKDEPQTDEHCNTCRHKDECEGATYEYKNTEWWCLAYAPIDEPQTDCPWK